MSSALLKPPGPDSRLGTAPPGQLTRCSPLIPVRFRRRRNEVEDLVRLTREDLVGRQRQACEAGLRDCVFALLHSVRDGISVSSCTLADSLRAISALLTTQPQRSFAPLWHAQRSSSG